MMDNLTPVQRNMVAKEIIKMFNEAHQELPLRKLHQLLRLTYHTLTLQEVANIVVKLETLGFVNIARCTVSGTVIVDGQLFDINRFNIYRGGV